MRPRTSNAPRAAHDRLPPLDTAHPVALPTPRAGYLASTRDAYVSFARSEAAKAIRPAEFPLVTRWADSMDREQRLWAEFEQTPSKATLALVHTLHRMVISLAREIGASPLARRNLGTGSGAKPTSRIEAFRRQHATQQKIARRSPSASPSTERSRKRASDPKPANR